MKIITNLLKDAHDEKIIRLTAAMNDVNPMVDRILEDESVQGVLMTNKRGAPIMTNMNGVTAVSVGCAVSRLGRLAHRAIRNMDPSDELLAVRIRTAHCELMLAPSDEFHIIITQHGRGAAGGKRRAGDQLS